MKDKTCEYCDGIPQQSFNRKPLLSDFNGVLYIDRVYNYLCLEFEDEDSFGGGYDSVKINFCPICGKKL